MENTIKLEGRCDQSGLDSLKNDFQTLVSENEVVTLDFSGVDDLDIRSLQLLASFQGEASKKLLEVTVVGVSDKLKVYLGSTGTSGMIGF